MEEVDEFIGIDGRSEIFGDKALNFSFADFFGHLVPKLSIARNCSSMGSKCVC